MGDLFTQVSTYIGIPWMHHGRSRAGVDCFGLILLIDKELFLDEHPDFVYSDGSPEYRSSLIYEALPKYTEKIDKERMLPGDMVILDYFGESCHIGMYVGASSIIHAVRNCGVLFSFLDDVTGGKTFNERIQGVYRWRSA